MMSILVKSIFFLCIFFFEFISFGSGSGATVECIGSGEIMKCTINTLDSEDIETTIYNNSVGCYNEIYVGISASGIGATWKINLTDNIQIITIADKTMGDFLVESESVHKEVRIIRVYDRHIGIKHDFFTNFTNLEVFYGSTNSSFIPYFTENKMITSITMINSEVQGISSQVINSTIIGGLPKLVTLEWIKGGITEIHENSFNGTDSIETLSFASNQISELSSCIFGQLASLSSLDMSGNPLNFTNKSLSSEIFQQLTNLDKLILGASTFNCTCDTQWISKLPSFGVTLNTAGSTCVGDSREVSNTTLYTSCEARSYQCFNKSIECIGDNWFRIDTGDGCECSYQEKRPSASELCNDINECENSTICGGNCTNLLVSYKCICDQGFYNLNQTFCEDVDECASANGNCAHNCTNEPGSHECSCLPGYIKDGVTECKDIDECASNNGNCDHNCTNTLGSYECSCFEGFEESSLNTSQCVISEQIFEVNQSQFYLIVTLALVFFITTVTLLVLLSIAILYFRRQLQLANTATVPAILSLVQTGKVVTQESIVLKSPLCDSVAESGAGKAYNVKRTQEANKIIQ